MARLTHEIIADVGSYQKDGEEKKRWLKLGAVFDNGAIKIDAMPVTPDWSGWLKMVEPNRDKQPYNKPQRKPAPMYGDDPNDKDTPF